MVKKTKKNRILNRIFKLLIFVFMIPAAIVPNTKILVLTVVADAKNDVEDYAENDASLRQGNYVKLGMYNGKPIIWKIINTEDNKLLLFSEDIISLKAYGTANSSNVRDDLYRRDYGSNYWGNSGLREWLNSDSEDVSYSSNPPNIENVFEGVNAYDSEPGFLNEFSEEEKNLIMESLQKNVLSTHDYELGEAGGKLFESVPDLEEGLGNYEDAFYENTVDKVFLLDYKQFYNYVYLNGYSREKSVTKEAVSNSDYSANPQLGEAYRYWLRTPLGEDSANVLSVSGEGNISYYKAYNGSVGVAPALYMEYRPDILRGEGSIENPCRVTSDEIIFELEELTVSNGIEYVLNVLNFSDTEKEFSIISALYGENGELTDLKMICRNILSGDSDKVIGEFSDEETGSVVKFFLWEGKDGNINSISPLHEMISVDI